eukprot:3209902-Pyramimonas_sp.AAC.2
MAATSRDDPNATTRYIPRKVGKHRTISHGCTFSGWYSSYTFQNCDERFTTVTRALHKRHASVAQTSRERCTNVTRAGGTARAPSGTACRALHKRHR